MEVMCAPSRSGIFSSPLSGWKMAMTGTTWEAMVEDGRTTLLSMDCSLLLTEGKINVYLIYAPVLQSLFVIAT